MVTVLIPEWGRWYSSSTPYREQVEALLGGTLRLSGDPADLAFDLVWANEGVHQVWGLGVPLWRLPFEAAARLLGGHAFPDMVAFALALALAAGLLLSALGEILRRPIKPRDDASEPHGNRPGPGTAWGWAMGVAVLLLFFPPFLTLVRSRFRVLEEAVAYEYVFGMALVAGLIRLAAQPTGKRFALLCLAAGFGGLIRPTLVLHGFGLLFSGAMLWWLYGRKPEPGRARLGVLAAGLALFCVGNGVLYVTNLARFGSGFEFGHKLNVQHLYGSMYATRFDHPYAEEPLGSALRELGGWLFAARTYEARDFYRTGLFPGQSETVRWREVYLRTFDPGYGLWVAAGWVAALGVLTRRVRRRPPSLAPETGSVWGRLVLGLGLYSLAASVLLGGFYLRNCVMSSRYVLDFMPCFAAGMAAAWTAWAAWWKSRRGGGLVLLLSLAGLAVWQWWQIGLGVSVYAPPRVWRWAEVAEAMNRKPEPVKLPQSGRYDSAEAAWGTRIPFNGTGWFDADGTVAPCVVLFVKAPEFLELELAPGAGARVEEGPVAWRAKVGLEFLERQRMERTKHGWRLVFAGPRRKQYQRGLEPVFLATVPKEQLAEPRSPWRLLRVRWREETPT
ncbi:MAG: hypothetical protein D6766_09495, partial [Verrucomicrobia bacterium]